MKLLREYIRNLILEQGERADEEKKVFDVFFRSGAAQGLELGRMLIPGTETLADMEEYVKNAKMLIKIYQEIIVDQNKDYDSVTWNDYGMSKTPIERQLNKSKNEQAITAAQRSITKFHMNMTQVLWKWPEYKKIHSYHGTTSYPTHGANTLADGLEDAVRGLWYLGDLDSYGNHWGKRGKKKAEEGYRELSEWLEGI